MSVVKKRFSMIMLVSLLLGLAGCSSSSDPLTDSTKFFATISRVERQNPGGMQFTQEQAVKLIEIISPVVNGMPLTADLAEKMMNEAENVLTKDQLNLIEETKSSLGQPGQSQTGTSGTGMGGETGIPGSGGGTPGSGAAASEGGTSINLFLRLDQIITENYELK